VSGGQAPTTGETTDKLGQSTPSPLHEVASTVFGLRCWRDGGDARIELRDAECVVLDLRSLTVWTAPACAPS
jgi:hypothetical protein